MRYLPLSDTDRAAMLATIGAPDIDALYADVPASARLPGLVEGLPLAQGELQVERHLKALAARNVSAGDAPFFCGAGAYRHHVPASVDHLIQRSEFLTTYTPYQPEMAQGTLQTLFEFQSQTANLLGCDVANASMYDGSTACAEAVLMAARATRRRKAIVSGGLHPHYREVVRTIGRHGGLDIVCLPASLDDRAALEAACDADTACILVQYPNAFGALLDIGGLAAAAQAKGALLVAAFNEAVAFGLVEPPGAMGADIVAGEGQSIGNPLNFGGPHVGLFATRVRLVRQMPGRLAGETVDSDGQRGFVLTLSTREQHIRRDKATSNICTNSGLCALAFTIHMTLLGDAGLSRLARLNHEAALATADALSGIPGVDVLPAAFFNEFAVRVPGRADRLVEALAARGVLGGVPWSRLDPADGLDDVLLVAATECTAESDIAALSDALRQEV